MSQFGYSVFDFGAVGDGVTDDTAAIQKGITFLAERGGGKDDTFGTLDGTKHTARQHQWIFDYVLTKNRNTGGKVECQYYTVIDNFDSDSGHYPSDHLPILSKIVLK